MNAATRPLAIVTGASSGIGLELARECARHGFDLIIGADRPLDVATQELKGLGGAVEAVQADLATPAGVDKLIELAGGRQRSRIILKQPLELEAEQDLHAEHLHPQFVQRNLQHLL